MGPTLDTGKPQGCSFQPTLLGGAIQVANGVAKTLMGNWGVFWGETAAIKSSMEKHGKTASENEREGLSPKEIREAAQRMMASAQAHKLTSTWCAIGPDPDPPSFVGIYFRAVSFELLLLSVEQSLRLLLLLHYSRVLASTNHNLWVIYRAVLEESGDEEGIRRDIISEMNNIGRANDLDHFCEKELKGCLKRHNSSYTRFRHFELNSQGTLKEGVLAYAPRDWDLLVCLAEALIVVNGKELESRGIALMSVSQIPFPEVPGALSEASEEVKAKLRIKDDPYLTP